MGLSSNKVKYVPKSSGRSSAQVRSVYCHFTVRRNAGQEKKPRKDREQLVFRGVSFVSQGAMEKQGHLSHADTEGNALR
jgi:hypothetical protein